MFCMFTLSYTTRKPQEKLETIRKNGFIPAVFYGKAQPATSISVSTSEFLKTWKEAGESSVVSLKGEKNVDALIHDVMVDPVKGDILHADFYVFEKGKKVQVAIPVEFIGVSPAVKDLGGNLVKVIHEVMIEASPEKLPHNLEIDISSLTGLDSQLTASDIKLPSGVTLAIDPQEIVASISGPKGEEAEEPTVAPDLSAIEVAKKGKKEEEAVQE